MNGTTAPNTLTVVGLLARYEAVVVGLRTYIRGLILQDLGIDGYVIVFELSDLHPMAYLI